MIFMLKNKIKKNECALNNNFELFQPDLYSTLKKCLNPYPIKHVTICIITSFEEKSVCELLSYGC